MTDQHDLAERPTMGVPDFGALFDVCGCERMDCRRCDDEWITPRSAAQLWVAARVLADTFHEHFPDVVAGIPLSDSEFGRLPMVVCGPAPDWYARFIVAVEDLRDDLAAGHYPTPRCTAEEMALHLILEDIEEHFDAEMRSNSQLLLSLPASPRDGDWESIAYLLYQDRMVRRLIEAEFDGIAYDDELAREFGIDRLLLDEWFTPIDGCEPRSRGR